MWMQDGCEVYMKSYMASNGSCFIVTRTVYKNHLLEASLTQNRETMALWTLTTVDIFYCILCQDPHEYIFFEITFGWNPVTNDFTLHLRVRDHTTWFWRCLGTVFGHFLLGSHNFMVTALGSCVKWPLVSSCSNSYMLNFLMEFKHVSLNTKPILPYSIP